MEKEVRSIITETWCAWGVQYLIFRFLLSGFASLPVKCSFGTGDQGFRGKSVCFLFHCTSLWSCENLLLSAPVTSPFTLPRKRLW